MGKVLIICGLILVIAGLFIQFGNRIPFFGKLPGDIVIEKPNFKFYFPLMTSIVVSILLTIIMYIINKMKQ
jgi:Protein of unknown function (DUF2905)